MVFPTFLGKSFIEMVQRGECDQLLSILLIGGETNGTQHHPPSDSNKSEVYMLVEQTVNFYLVGVSVFAK